MLIKRRKMVFNILRKLSRIVRGKCACCGSNQKILICDKCLESRNWGRAIKGNCPYPDALIDWLKVLKPDAWFEAYKVK